MTNQDQPVPYSKLPRMTVLKKFLRIGAMVPYYMFRYLPKDTWFAPDRYIYAEDGLVSFMSCEFLEDPKFQQAYQAGIKAAGNDYHWHFRFYIGLWAAKQACNLPAGDFVECGVSYGFLSKGITEYMNWNETQADKRKFFLIDTFQGLDDTLITEAEKKEGLAEIFRGKYPKDTINRVRETFANVKGVQIVQGSVPSILSTVTTQKVAFLSIDMNCATPEREALEFFYPKLVPGGIVLFDDYGHRGHHLQKALADEYAAKQGVSILNLPTGQGLLLKPLSH